jgi:hypothetical protein
VSTSPQVHVVSPLPHGHGSDDVASSLVPVERGPHRLAGGFVVSGDHVAWKPAIDVERVLLVGLGWGAAVAIVGLVARARGGSTRSGP